MAKLDRSRPFGHLQPPRDGAMFYQDGRYFDHHGAEVKRAGMAKPKPARTSRPKPEQVPDETLSEREQLAQWARGEMKIQWFAVKKMIEDTVGVQVENKAAALETLAQHGVV